MKEREDLRGLKRREDVWESGEGGTVRSEEEKGG